MCDAPIYMISGKLRSSGPSTLIPSATPQRWRQLAEIVQRFLPEAEITFEADEGGREASGLILMDNSRLVEEFEVEFDPFDQRVMETITEARGEG